MELNWNGKLLINELSRVKSLKNYMEYGWRRISSFPKEISYISLWLSNIGWFILKSSKSETKSELLLLNLTFNQQQYS